MNMKEIFKWGVMAIVGYLALRWVTNQFASVGIDSGNDGFLNAPYNAPIVYPASPVYGWGPPWARGYRGTRGAGSRRGARGNGGDGRNRWGG